MDNITVKVRGSSDTENYCTILLTNNTETEGAFSFDWKAQAVNQLSIEQDIYTATADSNTFSGRIEPKAVDSISITVKTWANTTTNTLVISDIAFTEGTPEPEHNYMPAVTAHTCTEEGYTTYTCSECGDSYTADETNALGRTELTQGENGWKLTLHPAARAGEMILKIGCTLEGRQLADQRRKSPRIRPKRLFRSPK